METSQFRERHQAHVVGSGQVNGEQGFAPSGQPSQDAPIPEPSAAPMTPKMGQAPEGGCVHRSF